MATILAKQASAIRQSHGLTGLASARKSLPPSLLSTPQAAKDIDIGSLTALAQSALAKLAILEPDVTTYTTLFDGSPKDRETFTKEQNQKLTKDIGKLLILLSPHLQTRDAQEVFEALLQIYCVHEYNVEEVLASAFPHHDSPMFTRLVQGLQLGNHPTWKWLETLKKKPATLLRSTIAKYCLKDVSVLTFVGDIVIQTLKMHKGNRPLATFFTALWLELFAMTGTQPLRPEVAGALNPVLLNLLRAPHLPDFFQCGLTLTVALNAKVDLEPNNRNQLIDRIARQVTGEQGRKAGATLAILEQLQTSKPISTKVLTSLTNAGAEEIADKLPERVDNRNFLASLMEACLCVKPGAEHAESCHQFTQDILLNPIVVENYSEELALAAFQAFVQGESEEIGSSEALRNVVVSLGGSHPASLGLAFRKATEATVAAGMDLNSLVRLAAPACAMVSVEGESSQVVPVVQAFTHTSSEVRSKAVSEAIEHITKKKDGTKEKNETWQGQQLLASLVLQATEDVNMQVVAATLSSKSFWKSKHVGPASAARTLETTMKRLMDASLLNCQSLDEIFKTTFLKDAEKGAVLVAVVRCLTWVRARKDSQEDVRKKIDSFMVPFVVLCVSAEAPDTETNLTAAIQEFCVESEHPLFTGISSDAKLDRTLLSRNVDLAIAGDLCKAVKGNLDTGSFATSGFGGVVAKTALAALLADSLPRLVAGVAKKSPDQASNILMQCVQAAHKMAWQQSVSQKEGGACAKTLRQLVHATIEAMQCGIKKSKGANVDMVVNHVVCLVLDRPRCFSAELKQLLAVKQTLLRPALLRVAFGKPTEQNAVKPSNAAIANALLLIRGYIAGDSSQDWPVDPAFVVPVVCMLADVGSREVRAAGIEVLAAIQERGFADMDLFSWESPCTLMLREAGVLTGSSEVLTPKAWAKAQELSAVGCSASGMKAFLKHLLADRADIIQDKSAVVKSTSRILSGEVNKLKGKHAEMCTFFIVALGMVSVGLQTTRPVVLNAIPTNQLMKSLQSILPQAVKETISLLKSSEKSNVPTLLLRVGNAMKEFAEGNVHSDGQDAVSTFASVCALPFSKGLADAYEKASGDLSTSAAEFARISCASLSASLRWSLPNDLQDQVVGELFRLGVAAGSRQPEETDIAEAASPATSSTAKPGVVASCAVSALTDAGLKSDAVGGLFEYSKVQASELETARGRAACELLGRLVAGLGVSNDRKQRSLLDKLVELSQDAAKHLAETTATEQIGGFSALHHLLLALAALSENISAKRDEVDGDWCSSQVCKKLSGVCDVAKHRLTSTMVGAVMRSCSALACLVRAKDITTLDSEVEKPPAPLQTCINAMQLFGAPLTPDLVALFKQCSQWLWKRPTLSEPGQVSDAVAQIRLRTLMNTVLSPPVLRKDELNPSVFSSMASCMGIEASLDYAIVLFIARRNEQAGHAKPKKGGRKRQMEENAAFEAILGYQDTLNDAIVDDVMDMVMGITSEKRYHVVSSLLQTACCLIADLIGAGGGNGKCWGLRLVPRELSQALGHETSYKVVSVCLQLASRFAAEHGFPDNLDEVEMDLGSFRKTLNSDGSGAAAESVCYMVWAVSVVEVLLAQAPPAEGRTLKDCQKSAQEFRELLYRSLAVKHPATFLRSTCLSMCVPGQGPVLAEDDVLSEDSFSFDAIANVMTSASAALVSRKQLLENATTGHTDDLVAGFGEEMQATCGPLCSASMGHAVKSFLSGGETLVPSKTQVAAWKFLEGMVEFCAKAAPKPVVKTCIPAAISCIQDAASEEANVDTSVVVSCCALVKTTTEQLGRAILKQINALVPAVILLANAAVNMDEGDQELVRLHAIDVLQMLVKSTGSFLSPFLGDLLELTTADGPHSGIDLLEGLGRSMVSGIPARLLLPSVQAAAATVDKQIAKATGQESVENLPAFVLKLQRLAVFQAWIYAESQPEFVAGVMEKSAASLLRLLGSGPKAVVSLLQAGVNTDDLPLKLISQSPLDEVTIDTRSEEHLWPTVCKQGEVALLFETGAAAFSEFALRLDLEALRPFLKNLTEWARKSQPKAMAKQAAKKSEADDELDADCACRALALASVMHRLAAAAPGIAEELLLPLATSDISSSLTASRRCAMRLSHQHRASNRKRRKGEAGGEPISISAARSGAEVLQNHTWWWLDVSLAMLRFTSVALRPPADESTTDVSVAVEEAFDAILDPCVDIIDAFEFLPPAASADVTRAIQEAVENALVALASAVDGPKVKQLFNTLLSKTRSEDVEIRLCAVRCCHKIWKQLGVQVVTGLSEVVVFASELLEDEDNRVEEAVRLLVKTMEECTGENLQDALKK